MPVLLVGLMLCLLFRAGLTMDAASQACRLFVTGVLPGLFPYMVLSLMLVSRLTGAMPVWGMILLGWGGGSPTGARLLRLCPGLNRRGRVRVAVSCATMSPMFLLGTVGAWLGSTAAGVVVLVSVLAGGGAAGWMASRFAPAATPSPREPVQSAPLSLGEAIDQAARTMLLVCGTMVMLRVLADLAAELVPGVALPLTTLLEVTTGVQVIAGLALPMPLRTALIAGATGFGGAAIIFQNRAMYDRGFLTLPMQCLWQGIHGCVSFLLALGMMLMAA
ncbi:MAG: hypothetical protein IJ438_05900 [Clostridia bacterium]|nr:hypothetical protein [Clostridia bacterium]